MKSAINSIINPCTAKLKGTDSWIHVFHLIRTPTFEWSSQPIGDLKLKILNDPRPPLELSFLDQR